MIKKPTIGYKADKTTGMEVRIFINVVALNTSQPTVKTSFAEFMIKSEWPPLRCTAKKPDFFPKKSVRSKVKIVERF